MKRRYVTHPGQTPYAYFWLEVIYGPKDALPKVLHNLPFVAGPEPDGKTVHVATTGMPLEFAAQGKTLKQAHKKMEAAIVDWVSDCLEIEALDANMRAYGFTRETT